MAKFSEVSEDVEKLFDEVRDNTSIPQWIQFKVLCNNKQKKEAIKVVKSNELVETLTDGVNFAVIINEDIFGQMPEDLQRMAIDECLAGVAVSDTDAVSYEKPDFNTFTGVLQKYGDSPIIVLHESIKSLYDVQKQKEDEEKAAKKAKKNKKS